MANEAVGVASSPSTQVVACHNMLRIQMKTAWNPHTDRQRDIQTNRQIYRETDRRQSQEHVHSNCSTESKSMPHGHCLNAAAAPAQ